MKNNISSFIFKIEILLCLSSLVYTENLILNNQTLTLHGAHTYQVISLQNNSSIFVDSTTCKLLLYCDSLFIDSSSGIYANSISMNQNSMGSNFTDVGAAGAGGGYGKHYYCGKAAESGIIISSLAIKGATGPLEVFEDRNGIINVINDKDFNYDYIERIGKDFSIITPGVDIKKYPVCYASHAAIDGINSILKSEKIKINDIKKIVCGVPPIIESNLTYNDPKNAKEAQFSIQFAIAMIIKFGSIKLEHLNNEYIFDTSIQILMKKIFMNVEKLPKKINFEDNICPEWSNVQLYTNDGNFFEKFIGAPIGSASSPLTNNMLFDKFQSCLKFSKFDKEPKKLYDKLFNIEKLKNCRDLFKT